MSCIPWGSDFLFFGAAAFEKVKHVIVVERGEVGPVDIDKSSCRYEIQFNSFGHIF